MILWQRALLVKFCGLVIKRAFLNSSALNAQTASILFPTKFFSYILPSVNLYCTESKIAFLPYLLQHIFKQLNNNIANQIYIFALKLRKATSFQHSGINSN